MLRPITSLYIFFSCFEIVCYPHVFIGILFTLHHMMVICFASPFLLHRFLVGTDYPSRFSPCFSFPIFPSSTAQRSMRSFWCLLKGPVYFAPLPLLFFSRSPLFGEYVVMVAMGVCDSALRSVISTIRRDPLRTCTDGFFKISAY